MVVAQTFRSAPARGAGLKACATVAAYARSSGSYARVRRRRSNPADRVRRVRHAEGRIRRPLARTRVLACMTKVCLIGETGRDGRFRFSIDPGGGRRDQDRARSRRVAAARRRDDAGPCCGAPSRRRRRGVCAGPSGRRAFGPGAAGPQVLEAGDGLQLTLSRSALKPRPGDVILDVAARRLPASRVPKFAALADEDVVAVYALHPFAAASAAPIAVRAPSDLRAGTPRQVQNHQRDRRHLLAASPGAGVGRLRRDRSGRRHPRADLAGHFAVDRIGPSAAMSRSPPPAAITSSIRFATHGIATSG